MILLIHKVFFFFAFNWRFFSGDYSIEFSTKLSLNINYKRV